MWRTVVVIWKRCSAVNLAGLSARRPHGAHRDQPVRDRHAEGELVWTGISDSFNPSSAKKAIDAVVKVVVKDLEKEGIF